MLEFDEGCDDSAFFRMNTHSRVCSEASGGSSRWPIRILVLALAGILFLTLYPFRFMRSLDYLTSPFLLGDSEKFPGSRAAFLNVLLFVPYGFGLAAQIGKRRRVFASVAIAVATGALLSYLIEVLQLYIPERDSGWDDVITNSIGACIGAVLFQICGPAALRVLRKLETAVGALATRRNAVIALLLYFAVWLAVSSHLQRAARLNWSSKAILLVGNSQPAWSSSLWKGEVYQLEFWDHALPGPLAQRLTAPGNTSSETSTALAAYDFSGSPPFMDRNRHLPALDWISINPNGSDPSSVEWNGASWAVTRVPVSALITDILSTRQFSVHVRCAPSQIRGVSAAIVSISQPNGVASMDIWQKNDAVEIWFETPLTSSDLLAWHVSRIFAANQMRDLLASYDGSKLSVAIDGKQVDTGYHLGPGPALASFVRRMKTPELEGYRYIFYSLVFFPAGSFLAVGWREHPERMTTHLPIALAFFVLAPILLELLLIHIGGQSISLENIGLGFAAMSSGAIWINLGTAHEKLSSHGSPV
jgi:glycopeptide antibiotics resistance protein